MDLYRLVWSVLTSSRSYVPGLAKNRLDASSTGYKSRVWSVWCDCRGCRCDGVTLAKQSSAPFEVFHFLPLCVVFVPHVVTYRVGMREPPGAWIDGTNGAVTWVVNVNVLPNIDQRWKHGLAQRTVVSRHGTSHVICNSQIQCAALPSIIHTICLICWAGVIHFTHIKWRFSFIWHKQCLKRLIL